MRAPSFVDGLMTRAASRRRRVVFAEGGDPRVRDAVRRLRDTGVVEPVVVLDPSADADAVKALHGVEVIDAARDARVERAATHLHARRRHRGMTEDEALSLARHPLFLADDLVRAGDADGCVAGAVFTTAEVMRAALWMVGPAPGVHSVSSAFYMVTPAFRGPHGEVLTFTDCAVIPEPSPSQLADIALAAAGDRRKLVGDEPVVALLSFATRGSADAPSVDRVRAALDEVRRRAPDLRVDGELQVDAALMAAVGSRKAPGSPVAGEANILVFPSLDAGNIGYKLVERVGHAQAIGPIIQGLARPCCDLSRGASPDDIMCVAAITALQA